jgi:predicted RNA-binding Zn ribbon-like protein
LAVELHNTLYAAAGGLVDGLADRASADAWVAGLSPRLPTGGKGAGPKPAELSALRQAVRQALQAVTGGVPAPRASIETVNQCCARAPRSRVARWHAHAPLVADWDFGRASRADVVLSALAADALDLLTGPDVVNLRVCGAPGCVLMFVKDHPRREWCSGPCGNRARQARHYRRTHGSASA